ncbi:MAG TPA: hypothetical protein PLG87_09840 [Treponemataceae bacterium]|nr:hypothetical protein [Treponemataceae bacterium]
MYKKVLSVSLIVAVCALVLLVVNRFFYSVPDAAVRITGIIILIDLLVLSFSIVRFSLSKKNERR